MLKQYLGTLTTITQHQNEDKNNNSHHKVNINSQTGAGSDIEVGEVELAGGCMIICLFRKKNSNLAEIWYFSFWLRDTHANYNRSHSPKRTENVHHSYRQDTSRLIQQ